MKIYILIFCSLLTMRGYSQTPVKVWDKTIGGGSSDVATAVCPTNDGGWIIGGTSESNISGDKTQSSKGYKDYWIVKVDAFGQKIWDKTFGGDNADELSSIISTPDGGFILAGSSYSGLSGDKTENSRGYYDFWIVKINSSGQKLWDKSYGGNSTDMLNKISLTSDNGFILAGYSISNISGDKTGNSKGGYDYWIIKIDSLGQKLWDKTIGGGLDDYLNAIVSISDGSFILTGSSLSNSSGDKTANNKGSFDYWTVKINSFGEKVWDNSFGGAGPDISLSIIPVSDGNFIISGYSFSDKSFDKTENTKGGYDYWIVKVNEFGQKLWDKTIGGNGYDFAKSATALLDGNFIIFGQSSSGISGDKTEIRTGDYDSWIVKINTLGQKLWDKTIGGEGNENTCCIVSLSDGNFLVSGFSSSNISRDKTENSRGGDDYWLVKLAEPCPTFSSSPPNVSITNSICSNNCTLTSGSISAPANACPTGSKIEYSTNNGVSWSATLPVYNPITPVSIQTRCKCLSDTSVVSTASVAVATSPATCQLPNAPISGGNQSVFATNPMQTLTATATAPVGSSVRWYDAASAGNVVANPTWNTIGAKNYFATSKDDNTNCESATRTTVTLEIKARLISDYVEFGVNNTHDPNAIFEVHSSNKGILFPRIDFNNRPTTNLTSGLLIYVILNGPQGNNCFYYWNGTIWVKLGNS